MPPTRHPPPIVIGVEMSIGEIHDPFDARVQVGGYPSCAHDLVLTVVVMVAVTTHEITAPM